MIPNTSRSFEWIKNYWPSKLTFNSVTLDEYTFNALMRKHENYIDSVESLVSIDMIDCAT